MHNLLVLIGFLRKARDGTVNDICMDMNTHVAPGTFLRVALPCYENRVLPRFGAARTFVIADLDRNGSTPPVCRHHAWDPVVDAALPAWLKQMQVAGILCGGIHPRFQVALETEGLWVAWGFRGEIGMVLKLWLEGNGPAHISEHQPDFVSCCRLPQRAPGSPPAKSTCTRRKKP